MQRTSHVQTSHQPGDCSEKVVGLGANAWLAPHGERSCSQPAPSLPSHTVSPTAVSNLEVSMSLAGCPLIGLLLASNEITHEKTFCDIQPYTNSRLNINVKH
jgi:hypothetical protein